MVVQVNGPGTMKNDTTLTLWWNDTARMTLETPIYEYVTSISLSLGSSSKNTVIHAPTVNTCIW